MSKEMIYLPSNYKSVCGGREYRLLSKGLDYICLAVRGKPTYIPREAFQNEGVTNERDTTERMSN